MAARSRQFLLTPSQATEKLNGDDNSHCIFNLREFYRASDDVLYTSLSVARMTMGMTFYNVNNTNKYVQFHFDSLGQDGAYDLIPEIKEGNYDATSFLNELKSLVTAEFGTPPSNGNAGTGSYIDTKTGILVLVSPRKFDVTFVSPRAYKLFGASSHQNKLVSVFDTHDNYYKLYFEHPMDFSGPSSILLRLNEGLNVHKTASGLSYFAQVPSGNSASLEIVQFIQEFNTQTNVIIDDNKQLDHFRVQLVDEFGTYYDFRGFDWTIVLQLSENFERLPRHVDLNEYVDDTSYMRLGFSKRQRHY